MARIAVVHSFYSSRDPSGENCAVEAQLSALSRAGHDVQLFAARTDHARQSFLFEVRAGLRVASGRGRSPLEALQRFGPDCVYIHNLFPNFSREWVRRLHAPVVVTLHNFRHLCSNALFFRDGEICTQCADGNRWAGVRYACYRGSRLATVPIAWANRRGPARDPVLSIAAKVVVLSEMQRVSFVRAGLPIEKLVVVPNFLPAELEPMASIAANARRDGWLFVGRLSREKGIVELLHEWPDQFGPLTVVGDGPLRDEVRSLCAARGARFLNRVERQQVIELMSRSRGLVIPSRCFEACPLVYVEALAVGTPILAWEPSNVAEFVRRDGVGWVLPKGGKLGTLPISEAWTPELGMQARAVFEQTYSEAAFLRKTPIPTAI